MIPSSKIMQLVTLISKENFYEKHDRIRKGHHPT